MDSKVVYGLFICTALQAGPPQGPPVAVEAVGLEEAHFFSDQQIRLALRFYGGQGRELDLRARPYQVADALAAPVGPPIGVAAGVELGDEAWHDFSLVLDVPAVNRVTTWELRHQSRLADEDAWQAAGRTRLRLYPTDLLRPIRSLATTESWYVYDPPGRLRAFLTRHGIPFRDLDAPGAPEALTRSLRGSAADGRVVTERTLVLWVRAPIDGRPRPRTSAAEQAPRALVFARRSPVLPHTTLRLEPDRTRVTVDIDLLSSLTDDPRAQLALVEAIRMTGFGLQDGFDE